MAFEKINSILNRESHQDGHILINKKNITSLKKAKKEIENNLKRIEHEKKNQCNG